MHMKLLIFFESKLNDLNVGQMMIRFYIKAKPNQTKPLYYEHVNIAYFKVCCKYSNVQYHFVR